MTRDNIWDDAPRASNKQRLSRLGELPTPIIDALEHGWMWIDIEPVGSRVTCSPAPDDTDRDWLVLIHEKGEITFHQHLTSCGWKVGGSMKLDPNQPVPHGLKFSSYKRGVENLIVTESGEFWRRFLCATALSTHYNLLDKAERIRLFQAILYGNTTR